MANYVTVPQELVDYYPSLVDDYLRAAIAAATAPTPPSVWTYLAQGLGKGIETFATGLGGLYQQERQLERQLELERRRQEHQWRLELQREAARAALDAQRAREKEAEERARRERYAQALGEVYGRTWRTREETVPVYGAPYYDVPAGAEAALEMASPETHPQWYTPVQDVTYETRAVRERRPLFETIAELARERPETAAAALEALKAYGGQPAVAEALKLELEPYRQRQEAATRATEALAELRAARAELDRLRAEGRIPATEYQRQLLALRERELGIRQGFLDLGRERLAAMGPLWEAREGLLREQAETEPLRRAYLEGQLGLIPTREELMRARTRALEEAARRGQPMTGNALFRWERALMEARALLGHEAPAEAVERLAWSIFERRYTTTQREFGPGGESLGTRTTVRELPGVGSTAAPTVLSPEVAARELVRLAQTPEQARSALARLRERLGGQLPAGAQRAFDDAMAARGWR